MALWCEPGEATARVDFLIDAEELLHGRKPRRLGLIPGLYASFLKEQVGPAAIAAGVLGLAAYREVEVEPDLNGHGWGEPKRYLALHAPKRVTLLIDRAASLDPKGRRPVSLAVTPGLFHSLIDALRMTGRVLPDPVTTFRFLGVDIFACVHGKGWEDA